MILTELPGVSTDAQQAPTGWHTHAVVTFNGSRDTEIRTGRNYKTKALQEIFENETPDAVAKEDAPAFIPSSYHQHDARTHAVQRDCGSFVCITGDIDKGNHSLNEVVGLVVVFAGKGTAYKVYSSAGATTDNQKWRVLIPLAVPVQFQEWQDLQRSLIKSMRAGGVELDAALTRSGQPVYLPNVPPTNRGEDGQPVFHQTQHVNGVGFDLKRSTTAARWLGAVKVEREKAAVETLRVHAAAKIKTAERAASGEGSPIDRFNDEHDVEGLLSEYGYTSGPGAHWRSPMQTTSSYGTLVSDQHWVSVSGSDRAAGLGCETKDGHSHGDAFDLFVHFEHKGDRVAALKACSPGGGSKPSPGQITAPAAPIATDDEQVEVEVEAPHLSEIALAEEFAAAAAGAFRWSPGLDWMHNQGSHWTRDIKLQRFTLAKAICKDAAQTAERPQLKAKTASAGTASAVLNLARSEPGIVTDVKEWDAHTMILNTPGDAYDLETGRPISREGLLFMQVAGVAPSTMPTPTWERFVHGIFSEDLELVEFIQRLCGYSLTGSVSEQKLFYLYGSGANGKSVFLEVLRNVAGTYSHNLPSEALMTAKHERHPTTFAALQGKRVAVSSEIEDGAHWAESRIKSLTGDATMTAHFMRQDEFTFAITHKHILAGNFKPRLKGDDFAIVRRMILVPFEQTFNGERADARLPEKLRAEYPGILQWFIEGARKWAKSGLRIPASVLDSSKDYMAEQNDIGLWMEDACEIGFLFEESTKKLYASYSIWKEELGERPQSAKAWSERLLKAHPSFKRVPRCEGSRDRGFVGLKLRSAASTSSTASTFSRWAKA